MRARFINEEEWYHSFDNIVKNIFEIWDKWEPDNEREGILKNLIGMPGEGIWHIQFEFPYGTSHHFVTGVNEYLKNYKIKYFGEIDPFEWEWKNQDFQHDMLIIKPIE